MTLPGPDAALWDGLAAECSNVFATRAWAETWWEHYGSGADPIVVTDSAQSPTYILPVYRSGRALRTVRLIGNGPADQLGPVCRPAGRDAAAEALLDLVADRSMRTDLLLAQDVLEAEAWDVRLDGAVVRRVASPIIAIDTDDWSTFLAARSKNFREQTRRRERKLRKAFGVELRLATAGSLGRDMATLFALHRARWGADAPFANGVECRFHQDFAAQAVGRGWLRLWVAELDGVPAAALYAFRFAGVEYFYQSGRDPAFEPHSVGSVLMSHSVQAAVEDGMTEYRLLRGDEAYKSRLTPDDRSVHTVAVGRTLRGRAAVSAVRAARRA